MPNNITKSQNSNSDDTSIICNTKVIINKDHVSCYVNVCMQCLLNCVHVRSALLQHDCIDQLKILADNYMNNNSTSLTSFAVREFIGETFMQNIQDASEFLFTLIQYVHELKLIMEHQLSCTVRGTTCSHTDTIFRYEKSVILSVSIPTAYIRSMNLKEMVAITFSKWHALDSVCEHCGGSRILKSDITSADQLIIIQLMIFSVGNQIVSKINTYNIKAVPTTMLQITSKTYKVISTILPHGKSIHKGYYTCLLRQKNST